MNEYDYETFDETLQNALRGLMTGECTFEDDDPICWEDLIIRTYEEDGVLTHDKGLVIQLPDGGEYQLTIVRSR